MSSPDPLALVDVSEGLRRSFDLFLASAAQSSIDAIRWLETGRAHGSRTMGFEYKLTFEDPRWYSENRAILRDDLRALPTFKAELPGGELRFRADEVPSSWSYDLRVFLRPQQIDIEVSSSTRSLLEDLRGFIDRVRRKTAVHFVDDDGSPVSLA